MLVEDTVHPLSSHQYEREMTSFYLLKLSEIWESFYHQYAMEKQIISVVRQSFLSLRDMYKACLWLPRGATESLVHSFVSTRLAYYNSLALGIKNTAAAVLRTLLLTLVNMNI